jgi:ketosteroid isomerase-like protein
MVGLHFATRCGAVLTGLALLVGTTVAAAEPDLDQLRQQVEDSERAFARTMAERDHAAFTSFLAEEAVFFSGEPPLRGRQQIAAAWATYFAEAEAPFAWEPEIVVVLDSGTLALSSGPVRDGAGHRFATFNSIWRLEADGKWRVVFDKGSRDCEAPTPSAAE